MSTALTPVIDSYTRLILRHAPVVVLLSLLATVAGLYLTINQLGINTDTEDMLSPELDWRQDTIRNKQEFPQYADVIAIVIDASTPGQAQDAALRLATHLETETDLFDWVFRGQDDDFFRHNGLLYQPVDKLENLADRLAIMQPFLARLSSEPDLRGLATVLNEAVTELAAGRTLETGGAFARIAEVVASSGSDAPQILSWQELLDGDGDGDSEASTTAERRRVLIARPILDYSSLLPGKEAVQRIRQIATELQLNPANGIKVRVTGGAALAFEELDSVTSGASLAGLLALVMVAVILGFGLRSLSLVGAALTTLICGLVLTAAFATLAIGELNLISVAFAVLYIGLGIDFAIHYCLCYRELVAQGVDKTAALQASSRTIGVSLALCAVTTATGFYAFIPTDYAGVAELGLISGTGTFISLLLSMSLLPALLLLLPAPSPGVSPAAARSTDQPALPQRHSAVVLGLSASLALASLALLPQLSFDSNPLKLQDPETESVSTFNELIADSDTTPWSIVVLADDAAAAARLKTELNRLHSVDSVVSVQDLLPEEQQDKQYLIDDIALLLGLDLAPAHNPQPASSEQRWQALIALDRQLDQALATGDLRQPDRAELHSLSEALKPALEGLLSLNPQQRAQHLQSLQRQLLLTLPGRLQALQDALKASPFTLAELPDELRQRWVSAQGIHRLEVRPAVDLKDQQQLQGFVDEVHAVAPRASGAPVVFVRAAEAVVTAFTEAFALALVLIALLLLGLLRSLRDTVMVLVPLLLAGLLTAASSVVLNIPFNFANIIALPLLLGIGVDSAIHIVHRHRQGATGAGLLQSSTARAVVISALTTVCSFGNLAFSSHLGTASMGLILTLGVSFTLLCTLMVLPALLYRWRPQGGPAAAVAPSPGNTKPIDAQLAAWLVTPLIGTGISPNWLTTLRLLVGLAGAGCLAAGADTALLGAWLFSLSAFLDHTDGELARLANRQSRFGHLYDLASDALVNVLLFVGIGIGLSHAGPGYGVIVMGVLAGISVAVIMQLRYVIEEHHGKSATRQPRLGWFEAEDLLYLVPLIVLFDALHGFLLAAAIGAPIAAIVVAIQYRALSKQWSTSS